MILEKEGRTGGGRGCEGQGSGYQGQGSGCQGQACVFRMQRGSGHPAGVRAPHLRRPGQGLPQRRRGAIACGAVGRHARVLLLCRLDRVYIPPAAR